MLKIEIKGNAFHDNATIFRNVSCQTCEIKYHKNSGKPSSNSSATSAHKSTKRNKRK